MTNRAEFVRSAVRPADYPADGLPEIAIVGRSNVGKSTLVNALTGLRLARTSAAPGKTRTANVYRLQSDAAGSFHLVDLPGYGYARAPKGAQSSAAGRRRAASEAFEALAEEYFGDRAGTAPELNSAGTAPELNSAGTARGLNRAGTARGLNRAGTARELNRAGTAQELNSAGTALGLNGAGTAPRLKRRRRPAAFAVLLLVDGRHPGLESDLRAHDWLAALSVPMGVVATKMDKLTRAERSRAQHAFERAFTTPVLPVSAATGEGLKELWTLIARLLSSHP